jgi:hypothetical protein
VIISSQGEVTKNIKPYHNCEKKIQTGLSFWLKEEKLKTRQATTVKIQFYVMYFLSFLKNKIKNQ